jgi:integrase
LARSSMITPLPGPTKSGATPWVDVGRDVGGLLDRIKADRAKLALAHAWRPVPPWLFVTGNGRPFDHATVRKDFGRMLRVAGLDGLELSPHSMRHSFACWHIAEGRNPKWIQQQLGHASITITFDIYGDHFKLHDTEAADALGEGLLGNTAGNSRV